MIENSHKHMNTSPSVLIINGRQVLNPSFVLYLTNSVCYYVFYPVSAAIRTLLHFLLTEWTSREYFLLSNGIYLPTYYTLCLSQCPEEV